MKRYDFFFFVSGGESSRNFARISGICSSSERREWRKERRVVSVRRLGHRNDFISTLQYCLLCYRLLLVIPHIPSRISNFFSRNGTRDGKEFNRMPRLKKESWKYDNPSRVWNLSTLSRKATSFLRFVRVTRRTRNEYERSILVDFPSKFLYFSSIDIYNFLARIGQEKKNSMPEKEICLNIAKDESDTKEKDKTGNAEFAIGFSQGMQCLDNFSLLKESRLSRHNEIILERNLSILFPFLFFPFLFPAREGGKKLVQINDR